MTLGRAPAASLAAVLLGWALLAGHSLARAESPVASSWTRRAAEAWLARARVSRQRGDTAAAISAYTEALRTDPTYGAAYLDLAEIRTALGDVAQSEWLLSRAVAQHDSRAAALVRRARLYLATGRAELANPDLRAAIDAEPEPAVLRELCAVYLGQRAWVAALAVQRRLVVALERAGSAAERSDAETTLVALTTLAAEADAGQHALPERGWIRAALRRRAQALAAQRGAPAATRGASADGRPAGLGSERKLAP